MALLITEEGDYIVTEDLTAFLETEEGYVFEDLKTNRDNVQQWCDADYWCDATFWCGEPIDNDFIDLKNNY